MDERGHGVLGTVRLAKREEKGRKGISDGLISG